MIASIDLYSELDIIKAFLDYDILRSEVICFCGGIMNLAEDNPNEFEYGVSWRCTQKKCYKKSCFRVGSIFKGSKLSLKTIFFLIQYFSRYKYI